jgi:hypothetical protein
VWRSHATSDKVRCGSNVTTSRSFPLPRVAGVEHLVLRPADLRALQTSGDFETELPSQLVGDVPTGRSVVFTL